MKSDIPVYILSIKRNRAGAEKTKAHLKKFFNKVKIYYGLDIKSKENIEKITSPEVIAYNIMVMIEKLGLSKPFIFAEDDVRITRPDELLSYISRGIPGAVINRLVYSGTQKDLTGTMMVGISNPIHIYNKLKNNRHFHFDRWLNKHYPNQTISNNFGINFLDRASYMDYKMPERIKEQTRLFKKGEREDIPLANRRRRAYI